MNDLNLEKVHKLAEIQRIKLTENEAKEILEYLKSKEEEFKIFDTINTDNVEPVFSVLEDKIKTKYDVLAEKNTDVKNDENRKNKQNKENNSSNVLDKTKMVDIYYRI